ncbi:MAG: ribosome assembly factor SBDS [Candidatus Pacearchaeota archaeon]|jgi:ribosome maturation protein SDO1
MTSTIARIRKSGLNFEIRVDLDDALKLKKDEVSAIDVGGDKVFSDIKKGFVAGNSDLELAFGTTDIHEIAKRIIKEGEVQTTQEHRDEEREKKVRQVVNFLAANAIDPQTKNPVSQSRIESALKDAHVNIKNVPVENQIKEIVEAVSKVIPIKLEMKKVKITIPAMHTGRAYGVVSQYKEKENWLDNGNLEVVVSVPAGIIMDFYDKLNNVTHGSAITEEVND